MASILGWIALFVAVGAVGYAWKLSQEMHSVRRRLDRYNRSLFDANDEIRHLQEQLADTTANLRAEIMQRTATAEFTPRMTIRETEALHPQASEILAGFHVGGCAGCAAEPEETLHQVCERNGIETGVLLNKLNMLVGATASLADPGQTKTYQNGSALQPVKIPNVELNL